MSITRAEAARLVTLASTWDNRTIGEAASAAWWDSGNRARWSYAEATEAIKHYYATTTDDKPWVMPSHITHHIRAARQDAAMRETGRELTSGPPAGRVGAVLAEYAKRFAIPEQRANSPLRIRCPFCEAAPTQPCTRPGLGGPRRTNTHPSRVEAARAAKETSQ